MTEMLRDNADNIHNEELKKLTVLLKMFVGPYVYATVYYNKYVVNMNVSKIPNEERWMTFGGFGLSTTERIDIPLFLDNDDIIGCYFQYTTFEKLKQAVRDYIDGLGK